MQSNETKAIPHFIITIIIDFDVGGLLIYKYLKSKHLIKVIQYMKGL